MPGIIQDTRSDKSNPWNYVIMVDTFMSGWGDAPGKSYYAIAVDNEEEAKAVMDNATARDEMKNIRLRKVLPRLNEGDHVSVTDKKDAPRWFEVGAF
jgi:hypothetical protein